MNARSELSWQFNHHSAAFVILKL